MVHLRKMGSWLDKKVMGTQEEDLQLKNLTG